MSHADTSATRDALLAHLTAFNEHDTEGVLAGLDENVTWATGADRYRSRAALRDVFDAWLWSLQPRLDVTRMVVEGEHAAMECIEHMTVEGNPVEFPIAVFVTVRGGLLASVRVFREGSADVPTEDA